VEINRRTLLSGGAAAAALPLLAGEVLAEGVATSEMPKAGVILVAMVKAKPGQEEAVKEILLALVDPTRKESGCLCYNLHQAKDDKTQFLFYEQWASKEALDAHSKTPPLRTLGEKLKDRVEKGGATVYELLR
jgi:quinol monooxygenase YgiN